MMPKIKQSFLSVRGKLTTLGLFFVKDKRLNKNKNLIVCIFKEKEKKFTTQDLIIFVLNKFEYKFALHWILGLIALMRL